MEMHERVAKGAALLDRQETGWHTRIDLTRFDMTPAFYALDGRPGQAGGVGCVLAQLNAHVLVPFVSGVMGSATNHLARVLPAADGLNSQMSIDHGFQLSEQDLADGYEDAFHRLTAAWRTEIRKRRAATEA